jgi:NADPH:quinone reductase-like Zn-dependent oxidoreductase
VPCSDAAGEVIAVGRDVRAVKVGDRVTSTFAPAWVSGPFTLAAGKSALGAADTIGVLAEQFVLPAHGVVPVPDPLSFEEACTLPCAAVTAWHALFEEAPLRPGDAVLTLGSGGVSVFALQLAHASGARVIATSSSDVKRRRLEALGAEATLNYVETPEWGERVRELTGGGVANVIEIGGATLDQSLRAVRPGGIISVIGVLAGQAPVNLATIVMRNIRLQGLLVGSREMFARMNDAIVRHGIRPVIDRVFAFDDAPAAFEHMARHAHFGKILVHAANRM